MSSFSEARLEEFALLTIWSIVGAKPQRSQSCLAGDCSHCSALHTIVGYTFAVKDYILLVSHSEWEVADLIILKIHFKTATTIQLRSPNQDSHLSPCPNIHCVSIKKEASSKQNFQNNLLRFQHTIKHSIRFKMHQLLTVLLLNRTQTY